MLLMLERVELHRLTFPAQQDDPADLTFRGVTSSYQWKTNTIPRIGKTMSDFQAIADRVEIDASTRSCTSTRPRWPGSPPKTP
jgi:hypothetical protein